MAGIFRFLLSFALIPSSDLHEHLIRILEGLGGQAGCHMCWALGPQRSLFGWFVLCSVGASRRWLLLRRERLPFASQSVRLELVQHGADKSQTQCD